MQDSWMTGKDVERMPSTLLKSQPRAKSSDRNGAVLVAAVAGGSGCVLLEVMAVGVSVIMPS